MSDRLIIPRVPSMSREPAPGWFIAPDGSGPAYMEAGDRRVYVTCGGCRRHMGLHGHTIAPDGTVSPSVVCPHGNGCGWHVFLLLDGWTYGTKAPGAAVTL